MVPESPGVCRDARHGRSDALLAIDKFALPLPMAQFWVLASYYAAQILIDGGILRALQPVLVTRARSLQEAAPAT